MNINIRCAINRKYTTKLAGNDKRWYDFNCLFINEIVSADEFIRSIRRGHPYAPCHAHVHHPTVKRDGTAGRTAFRHAKNWEPCNILSLDFDTEDYRSSFEFLINNQFIQTCAHILYSTVSSTPAAPRTRVVFVTDEDFTDKEVYRWALIALNTSFQTKDASNIDIIKAYAGNARQDAQVLRPDNVLPLAKIARLAHDAKVLAEEKAKARVIIDTGDDPDAGEIMDMLSHLPTTFAEYYDWQRIVAAVHSVLPDERGISLIEEWSPGEQGEVAQMFKSFGHGSKRATIDTLRWLASRNGWVDPRYARMSNEEKRALATMLYVHGKVKL